VEILKLKPIYDDEFEVIGYTEGSKGKDVGCVIWICQVNSVIDPDDTILMLLPKI